MPASQFKITPTPPISIKLEPGQEGRFSFTVESLTAPDKVLEIMTQALLLGEDGKGKEADWLSAGPKPTLSMSGGEIETVTITAKPKLTSPRGEHKIELVIADKDRPNDVYADSPAVACQVVAPSKDEQPKKRLPWWLIPVIAGGLLVLGGGGLLVWWLVKPPPPPVAVASAEPLSGRVPLTVSFRDSSTGTPSKVEWRFGDGSQVSELSNPSHTYRTPGTYTVELTAKDSRGRASTTQLVVKAEVPPPPVAVASGQPLSGRTPLTVRFQNRSTGNPSKVEWSFGDRSPISLVSNPIHTYQTAGTYTVELTAKDEYGGASTARLTVRVEQASALVAVASGDPLSGRIPLTVRFQNRSTGNPSKVEWSFGDGSPISLVSNPIHTYQTAGTYTVRLTVRDTSGGSSTAELVVNAEPPPGPVAQFQSSVREGKWPLEVSFTDTSRNVIPGTQWAWRFGDGATSSERAPRHRFEEPKDYTVRLRVSNANGSSEAESVIRVLSRKGELHAKRVGPFGGPFGAWAGQFQRCPGQSLAYGFSDKVEPALGGGDDTALNGIKLWCVDLPDLQSNNYITSDQQQWGGWGERMDCGDRRSYIAGARLRIESPQGAGDDTGGVDVELWCSNGVKLGNGGHGWGAWRDWSYCPANTAICGIRTKVEPPQGGGDDTALNDAEFECCYVK